MRVISGDKVQYINSYSSVIFDDRSLLLTFCAGEKDMSPASERNWTYLAYEDLGIKRGTI